MPLLQVKPCLRAFGYALWHPRKGRHIPSAAICLLTSTNTSPAARAGRLLLRTDGFGHAYFYSSWTLDWSNLLPLPAKTKSKERRRWKRPRMPKEEDVIIAIIVGILVGTMSDVMSYYFPPFDYECKVEDEERYSPTISMITIRPSKPYNKDYYNKIWQSQWKRGLWTLQVSDCSGVFPSSWSKTSSYTPLPPLGDQDPSYLRLLVDRQEVDDPATEAVNKKLSRRGASVRMSIPGWRHYCAPLPKDVEQIVLLASGLTGIAPVVQTIRTILEQRRDDDPSIGSQKPRVHVVWFKQEPVRYDPSEFDSLSTTPPGGSAVDQISCSELEKLHLIHSDRLTVEIADFKSASAPWMDVFETCPRHDNHLNFLQRLDRLVSPAPMPHYFLGSWPWSNLVHIGTSWATNPFKPAVKNGRLLMIAGSRDFAESLLNEGQSQSEGFIAEEAPRIIARAKHAGWKVVDLSKSKMCN